MTPPITGAGVLHSFGANTFDVLHSSGRSLSLKWSDPLGAASNDYDLFVLDSSGTSVASQSTNVQAGSGDPLELIPCDGAYASNCPPAARVVIVKSAGAPRALRLDAHRGTLTINTAGSAFGHNAVGSGFSVAAVNVATAFGGAFVGGTSNPVESYSSDGPRKLFFGPTGTSITAGNFLFGTGGGLTLAKVDLAAADCSSTGAPGFALFAARPPPRRTRGPSPR